jgi:hypothetical protein
MNPLDMLGIMSPGTRQLSNRDAQGLSLAGGFQYYISNCAPFVGPYIRINAQQGLE